MRMRRIIIIGMVLLFALVATACGGANSNNENNANNVSANAGNNSEGNETETVTITHKLGETKVKKNPETIVVFDFGALDTLDKLGIEVAGVAKASVPSYLSKYEGDAYTNIGSLKEPDFEEIYKLKPDLILISGRQEAVYKELSDIAPTVFVGVDTTKYFESFKENMNTIGLIFDKEAEVEAEIAAIEEAIAEINEKATGSDQNALIVLANEGNISAYGPGSRFGIIHDVLGFTAVDEGIEVSTHGMNVSFEYIVEQDPDVLFVIDRGAVVAGGTSSAEQLIENELIKNTKAYKNDNIVYLDAEYWYLSGGGLVSVAAMIEEVSAVVE